MLVKRVASAGALLKPNASEWASVPEEALALVGTTAAEQPNRYIRNAWKDRAIGAVKEVRVRAAHDGESVYFRLEWADASENRLHVEADFPDAAALLFPLNGEAPLSTMGSADHPVRAWFWRPDLEPAPESLTAWGLGAMEKQAGDAIDASSRWAQGTWSLVLTRALANGSDAVSLNPGSSVSVAVAVWEGGAGERAGINAYSETWRELRLEP